MFRFDYAPEDHARYYVDPELAWCPCCRAERRVERVEHLTVCGPIVDAECVVCGTACVERFDE